MRAAGAVFPLSPASGGLTIMVRAMRIGLDLGGTKIEVIALDDSGNILLRRRMPTPTGDYAGTIAAIVHRA
jgi:predicted NBD/HSP70 family sugar kinase